MKKTLYILLALVAFTAVSCDSFLDRQEDEQLTFEKIWKQRSYTRQYFLNCWGYLPNDAAIFYTPNVVIGASEEASMTWNWSFRNLNFGSWNASNLPDSKFNNYYQGIRDCNIFMQNAERVLDNDDSAVKDEVLLWKASARWARAYMYFFLMRDYGPVFLVGDEPMDFTATTQELQRPRNTWDECVAYVESEMKELANGGDLPGTQAANNLGLPTRGACLAVISRLKLYSARDLFNGNTTYRNLKQYPDGTGPNLFPQEYDAQKWVEAAQAAKAVIDLGTYSLYKDKDHPENPYLNYYGVTQEPWNDEIIFAGGGYQSRWYLGVHTAPAGLATGTAYGGWGPTQQQVDAYAMASGRYPITGYDRNGSPIVDSKSGYPAADREFDLTSVENPFLIALEATSAQATSSSPKMYLNREPRFYVNVYWPGSNWMHGTQFHAASFATNAIGHQSHDYPKSGYLVNRFYDHTQDSYQGAWGNVTFPTFRLAEIYLNYIEAVLECEKYGVTGLSVDYKEALRLWDQLRERSGMAPITEVYPEANIDELIELVRKERRVELSQEGHRYYDTRTWKIATTTDNGPMYGLDVTVTASGSTVPPEMWKRSVFEERVFKPQHYLYPFLQRELDRNKVLTQNYGW